MTHSSNSDQKIKFKAALEKRNLKHTSSPDRDSTKEISRLKASTGKTPKMFRRKSGT